MLKTDKWRMVSIGYLLLALLFFWLSTWISHRHGAWAPWVCIAVVFLVLGARSGPPKPD
jgi:predicted ABC-type exoprotein transport system permease subunit